ncbi:hypothetical protein GCM10007275_01050 [Jeotgalicoccus coquinae]|uniref:DUF4391 domain-containing protein n=1 Tax=Jeotgalicoccus coquinae TaxID=709509 RepID=A0A6V7RS08_9STAP|nr:DUF4391 domain-containing protein [Jeotgalicoccus coquinae]MBB6423229.1 hypothetical protein [Jeotgalicoccus coquinae]GGE09661.1 hypothetical protein GCM10007275_01050 [Jeotgalicoccus coquinae]CAD2081921.1 hypothetical protein JEOCOQ751_02228 [Jeotgalicoccus coquinae]
MDSKELINLFEFPDKTIVNQTIFKVDLYNQLEKVKERQIVQYDLDKITLLSILNESRINIPVVIDDVESFEELLFIYIELRTIIRPQFAFKTIASTMPYHMVGIVKDVNNQYTVLTGNYKLNKSGFLNIQDTNQSGTIEGQSFVKLIKKLRHTELPTLNLKIYYQAINDVLNANRIRSLTGMQVEKVDNELSTKIEEQKKNIKGLKGKIKKEKQLNRKIPLMQKLEKENRYLEELIREL